MYGHRCKFQIQYLNAVELSSVVARRNIRVAPPQSMPFRSCSMRTPCALLADEKSATIFLWSRSTNPTRTAPTSFWIVDFEVPAWKPVMKRYESSKHGGVSPKRGCTVEKSMKLLYDVLCVLTSIVLQKNEEERY